MVFLPLRTYPYTVYYVLKDGESDLREEPKCYRTYDIEELTRDLKSVSIRLDI